MFRDVFAKVRAHLDADEHVVALPELESKASRNS
jgi:hypothetical protein